MIEKKENHNKNKSSFDIRDFIETNVEDVVISKSDFEKLKETFGQEANELFNMSIDEFDGSNVMFEFLKSLKTKDLIKEYDLDLSFDKISQEKFIELSEKSLPIGVDESSGNIYYIDENEVKRELNLDFDDDVMHRKNIALLLDEVPFDVIQNGDLRRAKEAEAIYKVVQLNKILSGIYTSEIKKILPYYSFENLANTTGDSNFVDILKLILEESNASIRIIIGGCNNKLTDIKTKKDLKLVKSISAEEDRELRSLNLKILNERTDAIPIIDSKVSKAQREVERENLRKRERKIIAESTVGTIYQIFKLNTESIPLLPRIEIARQAKMFAFTLKRANKIEIDDAKVLRIANKMQRRGYREFLIEMKADLLKRYRNGEVVDVRPKR